MNIYNINAFLAVVHSRSMSKAAKSLYLTQSTISNRLRALEEELDITLFERRQGTREVELTSKGEELIPIAEKWIELWKETQQLKHAQSHIDVVIGSPDSLNICMLIPFFQRLANDPLINLDVRTHQSNEVYALAESRRIDIGLSFRYLQYHNVSVSKVFSDPLCIVCRPGGKLAPGSKVHPHQLNVKDELRLGWSPEFKQWHEKWWSASEQPHAFLDTPALIFGLMDDSRYWSVCSQSVSMWMSERDEIQVHPLSVPAPARICYFLQHLMPPVQKQEALTQVREILYQHCAGMGFPQIPD
jgi:Transcriptional regulator